MAQSAYSGNLRVELESPALCNVHLERSYLVLILIYSCDQPHSLDKIDFSKELVSWVKTEKYSLLDVNLFPRPFAHLVRHFFFSLTLHNSFFSLVQSYLKTMQKRSCYTCGITMFRMYALHQQNNPKAYQIF